MSVRMATLAVLAATAVSSANYEGPRVLPDNVRITSTRWRTSLGLRVGSSLRLLRKLYPNATYHQTGRSEGFPAQA